MDGEAEPMEDVLSDPDEGYTEDESLDFKFIKTTWFRSQELYTFAIKNVCVFQTYMMVLNKKFCASCLQDLASRVDINFKCGYRFEHFSGSLDDVSENCWECSACHKDLYFYIPIHFCKSCTID